MQRRLSVTVDGPICNRLFLSHHKEPNRGDFLIEDRPHNGVAQFEGEWIKFGTKKFEQHADKTEYTDWAAVLEYLLPQA